MRISSITDRYFVMSLWTSDLLLCCQHLFGVIMIGKHFIRSVVSDSRFRHVSLCFQFNFLPDAASQSDQLSRLSNRCWLHEMIAAQRHLGPDVLPEQCDGRLFVYQTFVISVFVELAAAYLYSRLGRTLLFCFRIIIFRTFSLHIPLLQQCKSAKILHAQQTIIKKTQKSDMMCLKDVSHPHNCARV